MTVALRPAHDERVADQSNANDQRANLLENELGATAKALLTGVEVAPTREWLEIAQRLVSIGAWSLEELHAHEAALAAFDALIEATRRFGLEQASWCGFGPQEHLVLTGARERYGVRSMNEEARDPHRVVGG